MSTEARKVAWYVERVSQAARGVLNGARPQCVCCVLASRLEGVRPQSKEARAIAAEASVYADAMSAEADRLAEAGFIVAAGVVSRAAEDLANIAADALVPPIFFVRGAF